MGKRKHKLTITQTVLKQAIANIEATTVYSKSLEQYIRDARKFIKFCREQFDCKTLEECQTHLQDYADWLVSHGYSASTIHTYLVAAVKACGNKVKLSDIQKPIRHTSQYKRGRGSLSSSVKQADMYDPSHAKLYEFCRRVGLRRNEIANIKGSDLIFDKDNNHWCIKTIGKGKKFHLQLIDNKDVDFIRSYFEGKREDEYIFTVDEMNNHLNLHALRAMRAKQLYFDTLKKVQEDPSYREVLEQHIISRWNYNIDKRTGKPKPFPHKKLLEGKYVLRGKSRQLAIQQNLPVSYDKTVLTYVSFMVLAHWRNSVSIESYLITNHK